VHRHVRDGAQPERHERAQAEPERREQDRGGDDAQRERPADAVRDDRRQGCLVERDQQQQRGDVRGQRALPSSGQAVGQEAADAGRHEQREQRHGEGVGGVAEEQGEPLDEAHLDQHESEPEGGEVDERVRLVRDLAPHPPEHHERREQEDGGQQRGDAEKHEQHALTHTFLDVDR
jgi:hypothetical protein